MTTELVTSPLRLADPVPVGHAHYTERDKRLSSSLAPRPFENPSRSVVRDLCSLAHVAISHQMADRVHSEVIDTAVARSQETTQLDTRAQRLVPILPESRTYVSRFGVSGVLKKCHSEPGCRFRSLSFGLRSQGSRLAQRSDDRRDRGSGERAKNRNCRNPDFHSRSLLRATDT